MDFERTFYIRGCERNITIALPDGEDKTRRAAIVLCHGHSRNRSDGLNALSDVLNAAGFITARFDFRGCGDGAGRCVLNCASEWPTDLSSVISYLSTLPFIDKGRIGVAGVSMGAAAAVYAAGTDGRVKSTVSMAGIGDCMIWMRDFWKSKGGDFDGFLESLDRERELAAATGHSRVVSAIEMYMATDEERRMLETEAFFTGVNAYVTLASVRDMLDFRPVESCARITAPIFFAHGAEDKIVPESQSRMMYAAVSSEKKRLTVYAGVEHNIPLDANRDVVFQDVGEWFRQTL